MIAAFIGDTYTTDGFAGQGTSFTIDGNPVAQKWENLQAQIQITPDSSFTLAISASADAPVMHLDIWRDDPGEPADLEILLMGPVPQGQFIPQMQHITVPSADVPTNQWVSLEVPVPEGFEVQQVVMGLGEPGTGDFSGALSPNCGAERRLHHVTSTSPTGRSPRRASWHRTRLISGSAPRTRPSYP